MKNSFRTATMLCAGLALVAFGCGKKTDAKDELEKAANALAQAQPVQPAEPQQAAPAPDAQPAATPAEEMKKAMAAYKAGEFEDAVTRLQILRARPVMTPEQRIALNDGMAAVMREIYDLAAKGDPRAVQAVRQYEYMQTQRH
jgi:hypothetical protein